MDKAHTTGNGLENKVLGRPLGLSAEQTAPHEERLQGPWDALAAALAPLREAEEFAARRVASSVLDRITGAEREFAPVRRLPFRRTAAVVLAFAACALLVASLNLWWEGALSPAGIAPATAPAASAPGITTLASRIQAAAPGEVIQVQPGRITESLRIEKPVRLTALGTALAEKG